METITIFFDQYQFLFWILTCFSSAIIAIEIAYMSSLARQIKKLIKINEKLTKITNYTTFKKNILI